MPRVARTALLAAVLCATAASALLLPWQGQDDLRTAVVAGASPVPTPVGPAAAAAPTRVALPAVGPFRRTARDAFVWSVAPVSAARLGVSHRAGCPVPVRDLRLVTATHWGFDGRTHRGQLVVHATVARDVVQVLRALHAARVPVQRMVTAEQYGADDARLMGANATSAYNCRRVTGGTAFSEHAYGTAIDVNPVQNPYVRGAVVEPPAGRAYLDRSDVRPGMVVRGGPVVRAFTAVGWGWGGSFRSFADYQHFSRSGR